MFGGQHVRCHPEVVPSGALNHDVFDGPSVLGRESTR
jgi:hypothetical protein